jgi:histone-lysine N-methyltransferase SETD3
LKIHFFSEDHRGVIAKQNIYKDEIILKIPKNLLISLEIAKDTELGQQIASFMYCDLNSPKHCLLSSFILNEKLLKEQSKWKFYLDLLPQDYSNFPIFFTEKEMTYLEGSPFKTQIEDKKAEIMKDYNQICCYIPDFKKFSFKEFCEVRMAVSSRIFGVKIENRKTDVLAPYADLLNHKRPRQTHWMYDDRFKAFTIQAIEDIPQGEEVYDSYGKKCNSRFLLNYGFIVEENDSNEYPIILKLDETCPNFHEKSLMLLPDSDLTKKFRIQENILEYQVVDFFSFLRFILFDGNMALIQKVFIM